MRNKYEKAEAYLKMSNLARGFAEPSFLMIAVEDLTKSIKEGIISTGTEDDWYGSTLSALLEECEAYVSDLIIEKLGDDDWDTLISWEAHPSGIRGLYPSLEDIERISTAVQEIISTLKQMEEEPADIK